MFALKKYKFIHFIITIYKYNLSASITLRKVTKELLISVKVLKV